MSDKTKKTKPGHEHATAAQQQAKNESAEGLETGAGSDLELPAAESKAQQEATPDVARLRRELEEMNNRYLRAQAELENYRKRSQRDMQEERRYASMPLMRDLLSVLDNMQRALDASKQAGGSAGLLEGVKMVADQLLDVLKQHGCEPIEAMGASFDPNLHEAVGQEPSDEQPVQNITRELRVGYQLHDRVVRPSQVFVSQGPRESKAVDDT